MSDIDEVKKIISSVSGIPVESLDGAATLGELGVSSMHVMSALLQLEVAWGIELAGVDLDFPVDYSITDLTQMFTLVRERAS
jgi:acyl carrier protein